jgi:hypothetical protein
VSKGNVEAWDSNEERAEVGHSAADSRNKKKAFAAVEDSDAVGGSGSVVIVPCFGFGSSDVTGMGLTRCDLM